MTNDFHFYWGQSIQFLQNIIITPTILILLADEVDDSQDKTSLFYTYEIRNKFS